jgi:hypothetical protein
LSYCSVVVQPVDLYTSSAAACKKHTAERSEAFAHTDTYTDTYPYTYT